MLAQDGFNWQGTVDTAVAQLTNIFQREFDPTIAPIQTVYQPGIGTTTRPLYPTTAYPQPFALLNPGTWSLMHWALIGGGVFLAVTLLKRPRRNPCMSLNPRRRRHRRNPFPSSALSFTNPPPGGSAAMVVHRFGPNPKRRRNWRGKDPWRPYDGNNTTRSKRVKFHGAFALKSKADAKAKRLGGWIKPFRVRGQQRYSVVTNA